MSEEVLLECARRADVQELLETLEVLGHVEGGRGGVTRREETPGLEDPPTREL